MKIINILLLSILMVLHSVAYAVNPDIHIYIRGVINEDTVEKVESRLQGVDASNTIYLHLNSPGGRVDCGEDILDQLKATHAEVIAVLDGDCTSEAFSMLITCKYVVIHQFDRMIVHAAFTEIRFGRLHIPIHEGDSELDKIHAEQMKAYAPYLTTAEMNYVFKEWGDLDVSEGSFIKRIASDKTPLKQLPLARQMSQDVVIVKGSKDEVSHKA